MKILIFNWRDIKNPQAGGAELVTHEISKRWINSGHEVTLFTSQFPQSKKEEIIDKVKIIRSGQQWSVHWKAYLHYQKYFKGKFDIIIDEINTIPFFTPLYVKERKIAYFNQLAREVWFYESFFPISLLGYLLEPLYLRFYRNIPTMVISSSTKKDLVSLGFKDVEVFPMAVDFEKTQKFLADKEKNLTIIYVGRLVYSKKVVDVIESFRIIIKKVKDAKLWVVGSGDKRYEEKLKKLVEKYSLKELVRFFGYVTQEEKYKLMSKATVIAITSVREGWGLIVTEANSLKTPAVVYNSPGLRDAVIHNETGLICENNNPDDLANNILSLLNKNIYSRLQKNAHSDSRDRTWEKTAKEGLKIINRVLNVEPK